MENIAKGISLHVGVNQVDPALFDAPLLRGCENDAVEMFKLAEARGFTASEPILGQDATFERVQTAITDAAQELKQGDVFLFTFAGHGSRRTDVDGDEADFQDETILLFDRILIDDFLRRALWSRFRSGVRIIGVADSCHGGSALLSSPNFATPAITTLPPHTEIGDPALPDFEFSASQARAVVVPGKKGLNGAGSSKHPLGSYNLPGMKPASIPVMREISPVASQAHLNRFTDIYEKLKSTIPDDADATLKADLLTLAACKDNEKTPDDFPNGAFTRALLDALNSSSPPASYDNLITDIKGIFDLAGRHQTPVMKVAGPGENFSAQRPFSI